MSSDNEVREQRLEQGVKSVRIYDDQGSPITDQIPSPLDYEFMQKAHYKISELSEAQLPTEFLGMHAQGAVDNKGMLRANVPWCVVLRIYHSEFQLEPTKREYFVYAPVKINAAVKLAVRQWRRWEKPKKKVYRDATGSAFNFDDMRKDYPLIDDGCKAIPIEDSDFVDHWQDVRKKSHLAAGNPDKPFIFTSLDPDIQAFRMDELMDGITG